MHRMRWTIRTVPATALLLALASACGSSPPTTYHVLSPLAEEAAVVVDGPLVVVSVSGFPQYADRRELVRFGTPNTLVLDEREFWAEPLALGFARVLAEDLTALGRAAVPTGPLSRETKDALTVLIEVTRFDAHAAGTVDLGATWLVVDADEALVVPVRRSRHRASAADGSPGAQAAAQSEAVHALARELAAALPGAAP
jgi:uncharacterized lipoprotein YmbA